MGSPDTPTRIRPAISPPLRLRESGLSPCRSRARRATCIGSPAPSPPATSTTPASTGMSGFQEGLEQQRALLVSRPKEDAVAPHVLRGIREIGDHLGLQQAVGARRLVLS